MALLGPLLAALLMWGAAHADDDRTLRFEDVTVAAGLAEAKGDRFSFGDYDADGDPDLLIGGRALWRNDTNDDGIRFVNVTAESGIAKGPGGGGVWADVDADGDLDVVTPGGAVKIQHEPGRFRDEAKARGLALPRAMATVGVGDLDADGYPDVLFGGAEDWNDGHPRYEARLLFRNVDGERFERRDDVPLLAEGRYGRAVSIADHDADGDLDVYLGNYRLMANELLVNEAGALVDRAEASGVRGLESNDRGTLPQSGTPKGYQFGHTIGAAWADLDADGDLDLWVSNLVHKYVGPNDKFPEGLDYRGWVCDDSGIFENEGAPRWDFTDARGRSGIPLKPTGGRGTFRGDELWSHAAIADLDLDGFPEVFVPQVYQQPYSHSLLFHNRGNLEFDEVSATVGVRRFDSYGGAFADLDGDGDPDLVTNGRPSPDGAREVRVYRNDVAPGAWIAFRVWGRGGAARPIGTQVVLRAVNTTLVREVEGASGSHAQQNEGLARFGLHRRSILGVEVRWPGGIVRALGIPRAHRVHDVEMPTRVPAIRMEPPRRDTDGSVHLRARASASAVWKWKFDLTGAGLFERSARGGRLTLPAEASGEIRVRLWHEGRGIGRERVIRIPPVAD